MKLLVLLLVLLLAVWLWRRGRISGGAAPRRGSSAAAQPMIACACCGVHVPQESAVHGRQGDYCSAAHRREAEGG